MGKLTHQDSDGRIAMVDVGGKADTERRAVAQGRVVMNAEAFEAIAAGQGPKGDAIQTAELAGIMAAKKTSDLIPLCHPLPLSRVKLEIAARAGGFDIRAEVKTTGPTGVEMEALTAVSVAALTLYDMAKAIDRAIEIGPIRLLEKSGGASGQYRVSE